MEGWNSKIPICNDVKNKINNNGIIVDRERELCFEAFFKGERAGINALKQAFNYVARKHLFKQIFDLFRFDKDGNKRNLSIDNFMKYGTEKIKFRNQEDVKLKFIQTFLESKDTVNNILKDNAQIEKIQNFKERNQFLTKLDNETREFYKKIAKIDEGFTKYIEDGINNGTIKEIKDFPIYVLGYDITPHLEEINNNFKTLKDTHLIPFDFNMGDNAEAKAQRAAMGLGGQQVRFDHFKREWKKLEKLENGKQIKDEITKEFLRDGISQDFLNHIKITKFKVTDPVNFSTIIDDILNSSTFEKNEMYMLGGSKSKKTSKKSSRKGSKGGSKSKKTSKKSSRKGSKGGSKKY